MSRAQELTDAHWNNYVGPLLTAAGVEEKVIALCAFMYKSSGIHFYKHCQEDAAEAARGALANDAAHKAPSLCDSEVLDFSLPSIILEGSADLVLVKYREEEKEWCEALGGSFDELVEIWDCVQARNTFIERGGNVDVIGTVAYDALREAGLNGRRVTEAKAAMLVKNAARSYYAPEVCKIILESDGERWR